MVAAHHAPTTATTTSSTPALNAAGVVRKVRRAVVRIIVQKGRSTGIGSGFVIDSQSHIITNNHVIQGARQVTVVLSNNRIEKATIVGADPQTDIAVLQVAPKNLPTVQLGSPTRVNVGDSVVAVGSALGINGSPTVTTGVVSAKNRAVTEPPYTRLQQQTPIRLYDLLQTDAAINPGNSGGPLLNMQGEVIGINTLAQTTTGSDVPVQGINFAVSIDTARTVSGEIIRTGKVVYPYIGILTQFMYPEVAIVENRKYIPGQIVMGVQPGAPASRADIHSGDIITALNGRKIVNESAFTDALRSHKPGDTIELTISRGNSTLTVQLTLATRPNNPASLYPTPTVSP